MKQLYTTIIALILSASCLNQAAKAATLKVIVEGIQQTEGSIRFNLFDSEESWLKKGIRGETLDAQMPEISWELTDLSEGEYALTVAHDIDGNGELNKGAFGKPIEPYGFSNDARGMFGPAKWEDAKFVFRVIAINHFLKEQMRWVLMGSSNKVLMALVICSVRSSASLVTRSAR